MHLWPWSGKVRFPWKYSLCLRDTGESHRTMTSNCDLEVTSVQKVLLFMLQVCLRGGCQEASMRVGKTRQRKREVWIIPCVPITALASCSSTSPETLRCQSHVPLFPWEIGNTGFIHLFVIYLMTSHLCWLCLCLPAAQEKSSRETGRNTWGMWWQILVINLTTSGIN